MRRVCLILILNCICLMGWSQQEPELILPVEHTGGSLNDIIYNQDNIVTIGYNDIMFWNRKSGALSKQIEGINFPDYHILDVVNHSYDTACNKIVLIFDDKRKIKVIDLHNGQTIQEFYENGKLFQRACISPDGKIIAAYACDTGNNIAVRIWDINTGKLLHEYNDLGKDAYNKGLSFSNNSQMLLMFNDNALSVLNPRSGKVISQLESDSAINLSSANFDYEGDKIVCISNYYTTVKILDVSTAKILNNIKEIVKDTTYSLKSSVVLGTTLSRDGKILLIHFPDSIRVWNLETSKLIGRVLNGGISNNIIQISNDSKRFISYYKEGTVKLWEIEPTQITLKLELMVNGCSYASFSQDNKQIITGDYRRYQVQIWDAENGELIRRLDDNNYRLSLVKFSADQKVLATVYQSDGLPHIWNTSDYKLKYILKGHSSKPDVIQINDQGTSIAIGYSDGRIILQNPNNGTVTTILKCPYRYIESISFNREGNEILTSSYRGVATLWDIKNKKSLFTLRQNGNNKGIIEAIFTPDGKEIVTSSYLDSTVKIWDVATGSLLFELDSLQGNVMPPVFNSNGDKLMTTSKAGIRIWDPLRGKLLFKTDGNSATFTRQSNTIIVCNYKKEKVTKINLDNGVITDVPGLEDEFIMDINLSFDDKNIILLDDKRLMPCMINVETGNKHYPFKGDKLNESIKYCKISSNRKYLYGVYSYGFRVWDIQTGDLIMSVGQEDIKSNLFLTPTNGNYLLTFSTHAASLWDIQKKKFLYSFYAIDSTDYLYVDKYNRYDGTENAIKTLYYSCDMELIGLDQLKEQLWVPNLIERTMNGEEIATKKLSDMQICALTPVVQNRETSTSFVFDIIPRNGGLGETILYINNIATLTFDKEKLQKTRQWFQLVISKDSLKQYFQDGMDNTITVKAYTADNDIFSRGDDFTWTDPLKRKGPINLYAINIGVSDYKGEGLDLKFPAKDANDLSNALGLSARKLLNGKDGVEHVFIYNINTSLNRTQYPDKQSIQHVFEMVGKKSTPNDIIFVFFAGHGAVSTSYLWPKIDKKQFYFLTADASKNSDYVKTGISMAELGEWLKPEHIKAQKRILIFDACKSGQAINDLVAGVDKSSDYMLGVRSDDETNRIKALEKLNERSGVYILSASGSSQNAYEMSRYSQGVLTYSLLKVIKEQPGILDDGRLLNVDKWFAATEKKVAEIVSKVDLSQQPQKFSSGGFNVGIVDNEVVNKITLAKELPLIGNCIFLHKSVGDDDLDLSKEVNKAFLRFQSNGDSIAVISETNSPEAFSLTGMYELEGSLLVVKVNVKQNKMVKYNFEVKGAKLKPGDVAVEVARRARDWVGRQ